MFKHNQSGFTFLELLAYLAIYGTISAAIISGIFAMLEESNVKHDLSDLTLIEKEIRNRGAILNNFSTDKSKSPILTASPSGGGSSPYAGVTSLQGFLCVNGLSFCQSKTATGTVSTSYGTEFTILDPGTISGTGYSFAIKFTDLSYKYCVGFADGSWGTTVAGFGIGKNGANITFYPYGARTNSNQSTEFCRGKDTFIIYYR